MHEFIIYFPETLLLFTDVVMTMLQANTLVLGRVLHSTEHCDGNNLLNICFRFRIFI